MKSKLSVKRVQLRSEVFKYKKDEEAKIKIKSDLLELSKNPQMQLPKAEENIDTQPFVGNSTMVNNEPLKYNLSMVNNECTAYGLDENYQKDFYRHSNEYYSNNNQNAYYYQPEYLPENSYGQYDLPHYQDSMYNERYYSQKNDEVQDFYQQSEYDQYYNNKNGYYSNEEYCYPRETNDQEYQHHQQGINQQDYSQMSYYPNKLACNDDRLPYYPDSYQPENQQYFSADYNNQNPMTPEKNKVDSYYGQKPSMEGYYLQQNNNEESYQEYQSDQVSQYNNYQQGKNIMYPEEYYSGVIDREKDYQLFYNCHYN